MKINEIFYSIQGESSFAGWPCAFIRLTGCDLRCTYCDTQYAYYEGTEMDIPEILRAINAFPTRLALITGGEPMLQESIHALIGKLLEKDYTVLLETEARPPWRESICASIRSWISSARPAEWKAGTITATFGI